MAAKAKAPAKKEEDVLSVDDAFLKRYVDLQGSRAAISDVASGEKVELADLSDVVEKQEQQAERDTDLKDALQKGKQQAAPEKKLHERAKKLDAASAEREAKEKQRELDQSRKEAEREEDERQAKSVRDVRHVTRGINQALETNVQPLIEKAGTLPTLGGIGLMVGILVVLLVIVVRVNPAGDTRAKQFWYMLNGRAKLQGRVSPQTGSQVVGSAPGSLSPGPGGTLLGPGIQLPRPDGTCPPGTHQIRGSAGNLLCQQDGTGADFGGQPSTNGTFRTSPTNLGF